ncbi:unnamed protein product [Arctia plantaginis]|uniref:Peptidase S1 domain-containing protein n=1 Tax=Arctia plantaginis TaxID=874455 RepID=A0A8S0ZHD6_ARCPL|nr:unnamed protein product [Arctia plantaginis]
MYVLVLSCVYVGLVGAYHRMAPHYSRNKGSLRNVRTLNLTETFFSSLQNYAVNAKPANETTYPWIARVVHSTTRDVPHVCTASCIDAAIFITAARCLFVLKVNYTTIIYRSKRLRALAFVLPSEPSKQAFDDIGLIVVKRKNVIGTWSVIELFTNVNRTDDAFTWFGNLDYLYGSVNTKVLGYSTKKNLILTPEQHYNLTELGVVIGLDICASVLSNSVNGSMGYTVPCYHSCTFGQMLRNNAICDSYHGVEGGAIFDTITNKLMGVATWGTYYPQHELPVGFAFANSDHFYKDFSCAKRIRNDNGLLVTKGYYQSICEAK